MTLQQPFLTRGGRTPWVSIDSFREFRELGLGGGITILFSLASNWNLTLRAIIIVGNKAIYGLWTPKILLTSINPTVSFLRLNAFFWEGVRGFHQAFKRAHGTDRVRNPLLYTDSCCCILIHRVTGVSKIQALVGSEGHRLAVAAIIHVNRREGRVM